MGRQYQGMDRPEVCQVQEGTGEQGKMKETGCEIVQTSVNADIHNVLTDRHQ